MYLAYLFATLPAGDLWFVIIVVFITRRKLVLRIFFQDSCLFQCMMEPTFLDCFTETRCL